MPEYVYGCDDKEHPRVEVHHGMLDTPYLECGICGKVLHKIPQPFLFGFNPLFIIREWGARNWSHKLRKEPRENLYTDVHTDRGMPQRDYWARK